MRSASQDVGGRTSRGWMDAQRTSPKRVRSRWPSEHRLIGAQQMESADWPVEYTGVDAPALDQIVAKAQSTYFVFGDSSGSGTS